MVPGLDRERLRVVWDHHVRPVLEEFFAAHPQRLAGYELDVLMRGKRPATIRDFAARLREGPEDAKPTADASIQATAAAPPARARRA